MTVVRRIPFCAGHRLVQHGGKCENLHGHNYWAEIAVSANETDAVGRVVDFAELKRLFKGWIDEHWDHGFIVFADDQQAIDAIRSVTPHKLYLLPANPTAENIARHLLVDIGPRLLASLPDYNLRIRRVTIWETEDAWAEVVAT
jgi:6-pyruvoyltetrahydropterin/6-carboxytetrahydropterin synthase